MFDVFLDDFEFRKAFLPFFSLFQFGGRLLYFIILANVYVARLILD